ncbi:hypothetical protein ACIPSJ_32000 [Streptomyces sp. NPDC090088]|uniref:hypothetical protein n=1 Tax=Streptomyces sp. NPDC090088 TaxID=3365944 RepID=UPI00382F371C
MDRWTSATAGLGHGSLALVGRGQRGQVVLDRPDQDVSGWIRFNLTAYHQHARTVQGRLTRSGRVWTSLAGFAMSDALGTDLGSDRHPDAAPAPNA